MTHFVLRFMPRTALRMVTPIWLVILVVGSLMPSTAKVVIGSTRVSEREHARQLVASREQRHRAYHWVSFGATTLLLLGLATGRRQEYLAVASVAALGVAIEWAQVALYRNELEVEDIRDDVYGAVVVYTVVLTARLLERSLQRRPAASREDAIS